jgi:hypothetical protein
LLSESLPSIHQLLASVSYSPFLKQFIVTSGTATNISSTTVQLIYSTLFETKSSSGTQNTGSAAAVQFAAWTTVPNLYTVFSNSISGSGAHTEGSLIPTTSTLQSSAGNFVVTTQTNASISGTIVLDGTLRIEGQLSLASASSLSFVNGSLYVAGTLDVTSDSAIALPNGVLLVGSESQLMLRITSAPILISNATTVISIPVASYSVVSDVLSTFRTIGVLADFQGSECYDFHNAQQVTTSSVLSVTLAVSPSSVPGCISTTQPPTGTATDRLSPGAIAGITIGCVAIIVVAIVLVSRWSIARRTSKLNSHLRNKSVEMAQVQPN